MSACRRCGNNDGLGHHICEEQKLDPELRDALDRRYVMKPLAWVDDLPTREKVKIRRPRDRENAYVPKLVAWINEDSDSFAEKNHGNHFTRRGRADIQGFVPAPLIGSRYAFAIECKKPGQHPTELQELWAENFIRRGGNWTWVQSLEEGKAAVKHLRSHGWFPSKSTSTTGRSSNSARRKRASTSRSSKVSGK